MNKSKIFAASLGILGIAGGVAGTVALQTHAAGPGTNFVQAAFGHKMGMHPAAAGNVTVVSGNTITVTDKKSGTSFTVDATNATIQKFTPPATVTTPPTKPTLTTITVSGISVGDNVVVQGTVSGTNIIATKIMDGAMGGMGRGGFKGFGDKERKGEAGTVSSISGNTITLTGKDGKTYTIDAATATVKKIVSSSVSNIAVGDNLEVQGTTSGNNVTATNILDGQLGSAH